MSEEDLRFKALIENSTIGIYHSSEEGRITYANPAFLRFLGYNSLEELYSIDIAKEGYADQGTRDKFMALLREKNEIFGFETVWKKQNGDLVYLRESARVQKDKKGNIEYYEGAIEDITEQINARKNLEESEERYKSLYENATVGIYRSTPEGRTLYANPAFLKFLGYNSLDELASINIASEGYAEEGTRERFRTLLEKNGELNGFESAWKRKNGTTVYLRESAKLVQDQSGSILYYEGTIEDITEQKKAHEKIIEYNHELKKLNASKDKFFSILAHDLKSPFAALLGYSEVIENDYEEMSGEEIRMFTKNMHEVAKNVHNLLENLLEWSRLQTGRREYEPEVFALRDLTQQIIELFEHNANSKNIKVSLDIGIDVKVFADRPMIHTVLRNLVSNALKFTNELGLIIISAYERDGNVVVQIKDDGVGMSTEDLKRIFRIDVHHTSIGTGKEKGTGLGLILCKEIVEKNGGKIWVDSKKDSGTTFSFSLPVSGANLQGTTINNQASTLAG
ncbi:MAG: PAS domain-containing sensor histidine kinase [Melioribacteraceae bacterium]|nr:PAS domain-containing sensor histidine kinase [Melioribacteraceae bacterium]MCF8356207.1 PAS domain-containing sensor histidine kinase [Melioribacteraceae bacterium]MCF8395860.1 PAS domain-containing sensor histidine kinase [Melioribacteraceae bacterium]MCF8420046.1 PAS domain-containing sensor histidine kinase [Melioribacteraceae bacterium]